MDSASVSTMLIWIQGFDDRGVLKKLNKIT
jgi:hypothetical protein